uniref:Uncharacterized protein n=1 Tax=Mastacembelus armatus TaxID=205130 RepID=A0A3Q3L3J1_9TELE
MITHLWHPQTPPPSLTTCPAMQHVFNPCDNYAIQVGTIPEDKCCVVWRTQPNSTGTFYTAMMEGAWWLCGHSLWAVLPSNWTGRCAPTAVSDHTYIVPVGAVQSAHTRKKRSQPFFRPHDSVSGSDVPPERERGQGRYLCSSGKTLS